MIITVEKSIEQTRRSLNQGFSGICFIPRVLFTEKIIDIIAKDDYEKQFNIKYKFDFGEEYINIDGNCNEFCKLMHMGGHLKSN